MQTFKYPKLFSSGMYGAFKYLNLKCIAYKSNEMPLMLEIQFDVSVR